MSAALKNNQTKSNGRGGRRAGAGRPKGGKSARTIEIETAAKEFAGDALKALRFVATKSKSHGARVAAAVALLDRGYGRPRQAVEVSGKDGGAIEVRTVRLPPVAKSAEEWSALHGRPAGVSGDGK